MIEASTFRDGRVEFSSTRRFGRVGQRCTTADLGAKAPAQQGNAARWNNSTEHTESAGARNPCQENEDPGHQEESADDVPSKLSWADIMEAADEDDQGLPSIPSWAIMEDAEEDHLGDLDIDPCYEGESVGTHQPPKDAEPNVLDDHTEQQLPSETEPEQFNQKMSRSSKTIEDLEEEIKHLRDDKKKQNTYISDLQIGNMDLREKLEAESQKSATITELQLQIEDLRNLLEAERQKSAIIPELQLEIENQRKLLEAERRQNNVIIHLKEEIQKLTHDQKKKNTYISDLQVGNINLREKLEAEWQKNATIPGLQLELDKQRKLLESASQKSATIAELKLEIEKENLLEAARIQNYVISDLKEENNSLRIHLEAEKKNSHVQLQEHLHQTKKMCLSANLLKRQEAVLKEQNTELQARNKLLEQEQRVIQNKIQAMENNQKARDKKMVLEQQMKDTLEKDKAAFKKETQFLKEWVSTLEAQKSVLEREKNMLKKENQNLKSIKYVRRKDVAACSSLVGE